MTDILDDLRAYLAGDNAVVFSPRRINEMIAAFDGLRVELTAAEKDRDNWKAHAVSRGKRLRAARDKFVNIRDELEDEGDRIYFGSTNDADQFKEEVAWLDDFAWDKVMGEPENWDLLGALENARAELAAERERVEIAKGQRNEYQKQAQQLRAELAAANAWADEAYEKGRASRSAVVAAGHALFVYAQNVMHKIKHHSLEKLFPSPDDELLAFIRAVCQSSKGEYDRIDAALKGARDE